MCTESMFTFRALTKILSKVGLHVKMQKNDTIFDQVISSLNKRSTDDVLIWSQRPVTFLAIYPVGDVCITF